jgi:hypothetical protein
MECRVTLHPNWPEGEPTPEQTVNAGSLIEAAEKLYGRPLHEQGANHQLRAVVRVIIAGKSSSKTSFFDLAV